jgi:hypothetical protein
MPLNEEFPLQFLDREALFCMKVSKFGCRKKVLIGGALRFFTPRYSFLAKKKFLWDKTQKAETSQKKQAKVCGQTKIANVALFPSQGEATSTLMHPLAYMIAQHCSGIGRNTLSRPSFPCW